MFLVEDSGTIAADESEFHPAAEKWRHFPASVITHHGASCCRLAREWLFAIDHSQLGGHHPLTGPRWLRDKFAWGPVRWPLAWCEVVERKTLDCGALAALANELFRMRGVTSYPAQLLQTYSEQSARHWRQNWEGETAPTHWIGDGVIYHEGCAVIAPGGELKIWDSTASWWVNSAQSSNYGGVLFLRVLADNVTPALRWGSHLLTPNRWTGLTG